MKKLSQKLFSQNFLHNRQLVADIIHESSIERSDTVLEIGPGTGLITENLLQHADKIIAVELDPVLYNNLKLRFWNNNKLDLINSDFLLFTLPDYPYKVFSNIPFRHSADIIRKLLLSPNPPSDSYLIVQAEMADKLMNRSLASVLSFPWFEFSIVNKFKESDFYPIPKVDTVLLRIKKRINPPVNNSSKTLFEDFVIYSFNRNKPYVIHLPANPTEISPEKWLEIFNKFQLLDKARQNQVRGSAKKLFSEQYNLQKIHRSRNVKDWKKYK